MDDADKARATIEGKRISSIIDSTARLVKTACPFSVVLPVSSINAFVDKAHETSQLLLEGERVLEAGHVFSCSVKKLAGDCCTLVGFILQTSALSSDPHEVEVTLNGRNVGDTSCSCKAG